MLLPQIPVTAPCFYIAAYIYFAQVVIFSFLYINCPTLTA